MPDISLIGQSRELFEEYYPQKRILEEAPWFGECLVLHAGHYHLQDQSGATMEHGYTISVYSGSPTGMVDLSQTFKYSIIGVPSGEIYPRMVEMISQHFPDEAKILVIL